MQNRIGSLTLRCAAFTAAILTIGLAPAAQANNTGVLCVGRGGVVQYRSVSPCLKGQKKINIPTAQQPLPAYVTIPVGTELNTNATETTVATLTVPAGSYVANFTTFSDTYLVTGVPSSRLSCRVYNGENILVQGFAVDRPNETYGNYAITGAFTVGASAQVQVRCLQEFGGNPVPGPAKLINSAFSLTGVSSIETPDVS